MWSRLALVGLAACSASVSPAVEPAPAATVAATGPAPDAADPSWPVPPAPPPDPYARTLLPIPPGGMRIGAPDGAIELVAALEDGSAAVTASGHGLRLWPTLDGTREPVVLPVRSAARALAVVRDGDALAIAALDALGQVEVLRTTLRGELLERVAIATPRPIVELTAAGRTLLARRDDHIVVALDAHGAVRGELPAPPGERIAHLIARGDHTLAILTSHAGRWLDAQALTWGKRTPHLAIDEGRAFLSPDGAHLLATVRDRTEVAILDLARGDVVATPALEVTPAMDVFGWQDAQTIVYSFDGRTRLWRDGVDTSLAAYVEVAVATGHALVGRSAASLAITTAAGTTRYLGYGVGAPTGVAADARGWVATDGKSAIHAAANLRLERVYPSQWDGSVVLLDARDVIARRGPESFVYDLTGTAAPAGVPGDLLDYDPASHDALLWDRALAVAHWDPQRRALAPPTGIGGEVARMYDPATNGGVLAVTVAVADYEPNPKDPDRRGIVIQDVLAADPLRVRERRTSVDRSEIFEHHSGPHLDQLLPDKIVRAGAADGTLVAELSGGRLVLRDDADNLRWERPAGGVRGLAWSERDELVVFGDGAAQVDLTTGELTDRTCGWQFGLTDTAPDFGTMPRAGLCEETP